MSEQTKGKIDIKLSKFLSLVLRHKPETIGIKLSTDGWVNTVILIEKMNEKGQKINFDILCQIVAANDKNRFAFNADKSQIRASQGHSLGLDLAYDSQTPPEILYHGTAQNNKDSIFKTGLEKKNRDQVHLSKDIETARKVGQRHGKPIVIIVRSGEMHKAGFRFYESENKVWLTEHVPVNYLSLNA